MSREDAYEGLQCTECHAAYAKGKIAQKCSKCNGLLDTIINPEMLSGFSKNDLDHTPSMWKYKAFLPVDETYRIVSAGEGNTPLRKLNSFHGNVWVKDETKNPTGTFKDRGASLAITALSSLSVEDIVLSSEGNAGCSFALYSHIAELTCRVFLPRRANPAKIELSRKLGATVSLVDGTIADAGRRAENVANRKGPYNASTFVTPFRHDGKGTIALEICEQFDWRVPDYVLYPVGGGVGLVGMWKMFSILEKIGWVKGRPGFIAVQPAGCAPVVKAYNSKRDDVEEWKNPETIAFGLKIPKPLAGKWILRCLKESKGIALSVTDSEIRKSMGQALKTEGLLLEPSSAATIAALSHLYQEKMIDRSANVVLIATGSGLKTLEQI
ncbi:MAG TPA: threonine synthase [Candidatus Bathyarchaeia archaeon]|nr:threonine synthase [Candidatus Bathyarchaeia archaeon]